MTTVGAADTVCDLVELVRREFLPDAGENLNVLAAPVDAVTTTWSFTYELGQIAEGALLSCGFEAVRVWSGGNLASKTAPVLRGYLGSTAAAHSAGDLVRVKPDVTDAQILRAINDELGRLPRLGIYRVADVTLVASSTGARTYDLATDVLNGDSLLEIRWDRDSAANDWPLIRDADLLPDMPTSEFPSGWALRLNSSVGVGRNIRVRYRAAFSQLPATCTANVESTSGLPGHAHDLLVLGAALRLTAPGEIPRNRTRAQGDTRRANEVPPGAKLRAPLRVEAEYRARVQEVRDDLAATWPLRRYP
jgi:hypothetical protein